MGFRHGVNARYARAKLKTINVANIGQLSDGPDDWSQQRAARNAWRQSQAALDDLIDSGAMAEPVRGFPRKFFNETLSLARDLYHQHRGLTPLRCAELAISQTYQKHKYVPSWNAQNFPEREIAAAL